MNPDIRRQIDAIKLDRVHGAGWLARRAISVIGQAAAGSEAEDNPPLLQELAEVAGELSRARRTMTLIGNGVCQLLEELEWESGRGRGVVHLRIYAQVAARRFILRSRRAARRAAERAADLISDGDVVVTCSFSSAVIRSLAIASKRGKTFSVLAARSEGKDGKAYGEAMARDLSAAGLPIEVFPDADMDMFTARATLALVGADTVLPDRSIINGAPSLRLARAAKQSGIPFHVVCETNKLAARDYEPELEEGFEVVPAALITRIITEKGPSQ